MEIKYIGNIIDAMYKKGIIPEREKIQIFPGYDGVDPLYEIAVVRGIVPMMIRVNKGITREIGYINEISAFVTHISEIEAGNLEMQVKDGLRIDEKIISKIEDKDKNRVMVNHNKLYTPIEMVRCIENYLTEIPDRIDVRIMAMQSDVNNGAVQSRGLATIGNIFIEFNGFAAHLNREGGLEQYIAPMQILFKPEVPEYQRAIVLAELKRLQSDMD